MSREPAVLAIHDTTEFASGGTAHVALGIRAGNREPVGILACRTWADDRWADVVREVDERYGDSASLIHVVDREVDQHLLLAAVFGCRFIVRCHDDRPASVTPAAAKVVLEREVQRSRRPRDVRVARLGIAAASLEMNIVRVFEIDPSEDEKPVEWMLLTNLPIETEEQIAFVIDGYRARWIMDELFKAVKTGCSYEKLELEDELELNDALASILPMAWQMLLLRSLARADDKAPAGSALTERQIEVLGNTPWTTMPERPTVRDAMRAVATLGGHIRNNGEPGWQVLYRGLRDLMVLEAGWAARSGQS